MTYLRPGADVWQLCAKNLEGYSAGKALETPLLEAQVDICVLPAEALTICPLWFRSGDDSLLESAIRLQLEKRNLLPESNEGQLISYRVVCREEDRVLLLVMVLSIAKLSDLGIENIRAEQFTISLLSFECPSNAMLVWRELGRKVVAFTRDGNLAHFQALVSTDERSLTLELSCLAMRLESEGIIHPVKEAILVGLETNDGQQITALLEKSLGFRAKMVSELALKESVELLDLLPPQEEARREQAYKRSRSKKLAWMMAAAYVALLLVLGGRLFLLQEAVDSSQTRQEFLENKVADVRQSKELWQQIQGAVESDEYPLKILSLCVEAIPQVGVQLTEFGINSAGKVVLAGRADSVPLALAFKSKLTSQQNLSRYKWNFPQPHTRKKGSGAEFKATGTRNDYVAN